MQNDFKVAFLLILGICMSGRFAPHPGSESAFAVRGKIVQANSVQGPSDCKLELYRSKDDRKLQEIAVEREFERSFVISPGVHEYYMMVRCTGGWTYKSPVYKLGDAQHFVNPVDLGDIHLMHHKTN